MKYEDLAPITLAEFHAAFESGADEHAAEAILRMSLFTEDCDWAERTCRDALADPRMLVRQAAATALGHIARCQRGLASSTVATLSALKDDPEIGGFVSDALDDVMMFAGLDRE